MAKVEQSRSGQVRAGARVSLEVRKRKRTSPRCWALATNKGGDAFCMAAQVGGDGLAAPVGSDGWCSAWRARGGTRSGPWDGPSPKAVGLGSILMGRMVAEAGPI
jgi:hypothetical protein